jgi:hypothetical protein
LLFGFNWQAFGAMEATEFVVEAWEAIGFAAGQAMEAWGRYGLATGEALGGCGFVILQFGFNWEAFGATEAAEFAVEAQEAMGLAAGKAMEA